MSPLLRTICLRRLEIVGDHVRAFLDEQACPISGIERLGKVGEKVGANGGAVGAGVDRVPALGLVEAIRKLEIGTRIAEIWDVHK